MLILNVKYLPAVIATFVFSLVLGVAYVNRPAPCANSISCVKNQKVAVENGVMGRFLGQEVVPPQVDLVAEAQAAKNAVVLGDNDSTTPKRIMVDLTNQKLQAYEGDELFMEALVSTGLWGRTPTGDFKIWSKLRSTRMNGGSGADYYDLPNVPFTMFYSNSEVPGGRGFSLHGAYWHNNFGHEMSHGCVNMRTVDAEKLFNWVGDDLEGTTITVYEQPS